MYLLYLDEFGHPGPYLPSDPNHSHHPLFGFAGCAIPGDQVREFDRSFLRRKQSFYSEEIQDSSDRAERYEPKRINGRRDLRFAHEVLHLVGECEGFLFAVGCEKNSDDIQSHSYKGLYTSTVQASLRRFESYLQEGPEKGVTPGIIIMDRRQELANLRVLESAQTHLFSHDLFRREDVGIAETPLLVHSHWYHGIQAAHVVGQVVGKVYWHRMVDDTRYERYESNLGETLDAQGYSTEGWSTVYLWSF